MADLTIGEVNKVLRLNCTSIDQTVNPPVQSPLDLTGATIALIWVITSSTQAKPEAPITTKAMTIVGAPTAGVCQYIFQAGDLAKPAEMKKTGQFRYTVKVTYGDGSVFYSRFDGKLDIKDDSTL